MSQWFWALGPAERFIWLQGILECTIASGSSCNHRIYGTQKGTYPLYEPELVEQVFGTSMLFLTSDGTVNVAASNGHHDIEVREYAWYTHAPLVPSPGAQDMA